jgi:pimeloyl-ACP methyl ester carboxylesterase
VILPASLGAARDHVTPAAIPVTDQVLQDLMARLERWREPPRTSCHDWSRGIPAGELRRLVGRWRDVFDWNASTRPLETYQSLFFSADGARGVTLPLHLLCGSAARESSGTIIMVHGWPGTPLDFIECGAGLMNAPEGEPCFDVVIVSLPGFGLSRHPQEPMNARAMAHVIAALVGRIDGPVILHGSDWGATAASWLALDFPERVTGLHLSMMGLKPDLSGAPAVSDAEQAWLKAVRTRLAGDGGYAEIQASAPATIGAALSDSPVAVLAWVAEKFRRWSSLDPGAGIGPTDDMILAQATLHWAANDLPSAAWIYWAERHMSEPSQATRPGPVPTGFTLCAGGFFPPPPVEWAARLHDVVFREVLPGGGHFGAWLHPADYAASLRRFAQEVTQ